MRSRKNSDCRLNTKQKPPEVCVLSVWKWKIPSTFSIQPTVTSAKCPEEKVGFCSCVTHIFSFHAFKPRRKISHWWKWRFSDETRVHKNVSWLTYAGDERNTWSVHSENNDNDKIQICKTSYVNEESGWATFHKTKQNWEHSFEDNSFVSCSFATEGDKSEVSYWLRKKMVHQTLSNLRLSKEVLRSETCFHDWSKFWPQKHGDLRSFRHSDTPKRKWPPNSSRKSKAQWTRSFSLWRAHNMLTSKHTPFRQFSDTTSWWTNGPTQIEAVCAILLPLFSWTTENLALAGKLEFFALGEGNCLQKRPCLGQENESSTRHNRDTMLYISAQPSATKQSTNCAMNAKILLLQQTPSNNCVLFCQHEMIVFFVLWNA